MEQHSRDELHSTSEIITTRVPDNSNSVSEHGDEDVTDRNLSSYQLAKDRLKRDKRTALDMYGFGRVSNSYIVSYALNVVGEIILAEPASCYESITC